MQLDCLTYSAINIDSATTEYTRVEKIPLHMNKESCYSNESVMVYQLCVINPLISRKHVPSIWQSLISGSISRLLLQSNQAITDVGKDSASVGYRHDGN